MSRRHHKRHLPFVALSRRKRANAVIRLKGQIRRDASEYGGRFTSHQVLNEPGRPDLYSQWASVCFAGTDRCTLWNVDIITARQAFWDKVHNEAFLRAWGALSKDEQAQEGQMEFEPADTSPTGKVLSYRMIKQEKVCYPQFDGRTFHQQVDQLEAVIIRDEPPPIHESFTCDRGYAYGIGLHAVLDVDVINLSSIDMAIERFFAVGESDWTSPETVPRTRLPMMTKEVALASLVRPALGQDEVY